jgi:PIN domain nuclease of toxin-antitoxin system
VKLILDTNALIWWLKDNSKLGPRARAILADPSNNLLTSIVSLWELSLKWRVGKLEHKGSTFIPLLASQNVTLLDIEPHHFAVLEGLPVHHGDPYDHMILAQAQAEGATIITSDRYMSLYGVRCIDCR